MIRPVFRFFIFLLFVGIFTAKVKGQDNFGGPYEPDSTTVLLMHFDGDVTNETNRTGDARIFGDVSYISTKSAGDFDQQLRLNNDAAQKKSHLQVPDTAALDLTGNWTMELWVNVFTFGTDSDDWRWQPRLYFKPGDGGPDGDVPYYYSNYFFNIFGSNRDFATGYWNPEAENWVEIRSPQNVMKVGEWFHLTFIRDTSRQMIMQMIHQNANNRAQLTSNPDNLELVHFEILDYGSDGLTGQPRTSDQPLFIGTSPQLDTTFANLDGFIDEVRISNTVRRFNIPPIISNVTNLDNQQSDISYEISASVETMSYLNLGQVRLHYQVDDRSWNAVDMSNKTGAAYRATIPSQEVGSTIKYWISAETKGGLRATKPASAQSSNTYYRFGIWRDSTQVLELSFDESTDGEDPDDQSQYDAAVSYEGLTEPKYGAGDEEEGDQALHFSSEDSTYLGVSPTFQSSDNFLVDLKFKAQDSVPRAGTRLIYKGLPGVFYYSNYQVFIDEGGLIRPSAYLPNNETYLGPILGPFLILDSPESRIEAGKWYHLIFGLDSGVAFARLKNLEGDIINERGGPVDHSPVTTDDSLFIGGLGSEVSAPHFNGLMDDIRVFNYAPNRYLPDSLRDTGLKPASSTPKRVELKQNYPNPFNPSTSITYKLPRPSNVKLSVYTVTGKKVITLVDEFRQTGSYTVSFNGSELASGVYIYRLRTRDFTKTRKMLMIK